MEVVHVIGRLVARESEHLEISRARFAELLRTKRRPFQKRAFVQAELTQEVVARFRGARNVPGKISNGSRRTTAHRSPHDALTDCSSFAWEVIQRARCSPPYSNMSVGVSPARKGSMNARGRCGCQITAEFPPPPRHSRRHFIKFTCCAIPAGAPSTKTRMRYVPVLASAAFQWSWWDPGARNPSTRIATSRPNTS